LFVVFELASALVFPWGFRTQTLTAVTCLGLYATLLWTQPMATAIGVDTSLPTVAYTLYAVAAAGLVSVLGAAVLDGQRLVQFTQREQLDQHLIAFRELTRAFRGFDPQRVVFLACRAAVQTFGLRSLWVTWQAVGASAPGYLVHDVDGTLDW